MTNIYNISWVEVKGALVSGILMAILVVLIQMIQVGNIFSLDWKSLLNVGIFAFITSIVSFLKSFLTNKTGKFIGKIQVKNIT